MKYPRIGVVGAGSLAGDQIYPNLAPAGLKLVAVCDLDCSKARAKAEQYGGEAFDDMGSMLATADLDGVILCAGPEFHASGAMRVLEAGLPVYTEKPPSVCAADLLGVVKRAREKGLVAMTAMKKRYANVYQQARDLVEAQAFGDPWHLSMFRVSSIRWKNLNPRTDHLLDYCVHNIDLAEFLFGDVSSVQAQRHGKQVYQVTLEFESGAIGVLNFVEREGAQPVEQVELTGSGGWVSIVDQCALRAGVAGKLICDSRANMTTAGADGGAITGHRTELSAFASAIRDGTRPPSHIEAAYHTMCVYDAIVRSLVSGQRESVVPASAQAGG